MTSASHQKSLRRLTLGWACRRLGLSLLFLAGAVPLWLGLLVVTYMMVMPSPRHGRIYEIDGPIHRRLALAITTGIFLLSLAALLSGREKMDSETATVQEDPSNPLWEFCKLPAWLVSSALKNLLAAFLLLAVDHRVLGALLTRLAAGRYPLALLEQNYPGRHKFYRAVLIAIPGVQLLGAEHPYFLMTSQTRKILDGKAPD
ncbi:MAG: hypothetical protein AB7F32_00485 [Victivallaceae bacterium]